MGVAVAGCVPFGRTLDTLNPDTPELTIVMRHVADDGKVVQPVLTKVTLRRWYGHIQAHVQSSPLDHRALGLAVAEGGKVTLPYYVPAEGSDPSKFMYRVDITQYMENSIESVVYLLERNRLRGEASPDGRTEHPIAATGVVHVDVPYRRTQWEQPALTENERLLSRMGTATELAQEEIHLLPEPSRRVLATWMLDRLERLRSAGVGKQQTLWTKCRAFWASVD